MRSAQPDNLRVRYRHRHRHRLGMSARTCAFARALPLLVDDRCITCVVPILSHTLYAIVICFLLLASALCEAAFVCSCSVLSALLWECVFATLFAKCLREWCSEVAIWMCVLSVLVSICAIPFNITLFLIISDLWIYIMQSFDWQWSVIKTDTNSESCRELRRMSR
jgi:hypothetical protein